MKTQNGNALFLILIAVALFAALSYAVTQSGRGGGNIDREQGELRAAQLMSLIGEYEQQIMRLKLMDGYDQVIFMDWDGGTGTCYSGAIATTPCRRIGLFSEEGGGRIPPLSADTPPGYPDYPYWAMLGWASERVVVNGVDLGSSAPDVYLEIGPLTLETCRALNRRLNGAANFSFTAEPRSASGGDGWAYVYHYDGSFDSVLVAGSDGVDVTSPYGCAEQSNGWYYLFYVIEIN